MREIVHMQAGQCGNQIGAKVIWFSLSFVLKLTSKYRVFICSKVNFEKFSFVAVAERVPAYFFTIFNDELFFNLSGISLSIMFESFEQ